MSFYEVFFMYSFYYIEPQIDQLAQQQAAIHKAVLKIIEGKADKVSLLDTTLTSSNKDRAYLNAYHPFYNLIVAYHYFDANVFDEVLKSNRKSLSPYCQLLQQCDVFIHIREATGLAIEIDGQLSINLSALEEVYWLLGALKIGSCSPEFRRAISQYKHDTGYTDNLRHYSHYIRNLFNAYSRLLVIRIDLGYQQQQRIDYAAFRADMDYLLRLIPIHPIFKDLAGYIWKLEHGNDKGYHVHLLLLYDGAQRKSDYYIAMQVGEFWQKDITLGRGLYFNCNTKEQKEQYHYCYLGVVHRDEQPKIDCMIEQGVKYLVKTDEYLRLTKPDNRRTLGRGVIKSKK